MTIVGSAGHSRESCCSSPRMCRALGVARRRVRCSGGAESRDVSELARRITPPTTHTAIQPQAHAMDPVIKAMTRRPNPIAASTNVTTSTTPPQPRCGPGPGPRSAVAFGKGRRTERRRVGLVERIRTAVHRHRGTALLELLQLRFEVRLQAHAVFTLERLERSIRSSRTERC